MVFSGIMIIVMAASCAHYEPRWTPETVSARLQQEQACAVVRRLEQTIESDARKAVVEGESQLEQMEASGQEVLQREEELAIETEEIRPGRSTHLDVLQVQKNLVQSKLDEVTARVRHLEALGDLYRVEGTLLTRRNDCPRSV